MSSYRPIPLWLHAGVETFAAPAIMAAPFFFGFGPAASVICVTTGALLLGLALQVPGPQRSVSISAHSSFDYALALFAVAGGLAVGLISGAWGATIFLVGIGAALAALTASTRFSMPRGA
ncbi:MAG: hypothetical protein QOI31_2579 [Solirubrobacterales bacterium]|jgi:hypothetical protein|nr:hypothetical protein [Solirubrobacterales bacterium]